RDEPTRLPAEPAGLAAARIPSRVDTPHAARQPARRGADSIGLAVESIQLRAELSSLPRKVVRSKQEVVLKFRNRFASPGEKVHPRAQSVQLAPGKIQLRAELIQLRAELVRLLTNPVRRGMRPSWGIAGSAAAAAPITLAPAPPGSSPRVRRPPRRR